MMMLSLTDTQQSTGNPIECDDEGNGDDYELDHSAGDPIDDNDDDDDGCYHNTDDQSAGDPVECVFQATSCLPRTPVPGHEEGDGDYVDDDDDNDE